MFISRQREVINAFNIFISNLDKLRHESSPRDKSWDYIKTKCKNYTKSQYFKDVKYGNAIDIYGSLVVRDWVFDFIDIINKSSKMQTTVHLYKDRRTGLCESILRIFTYEKII